MARRAEDNGESLNDIESQNKLAIVLRMEKKSVNNNEGRKVP